MGARGQSHHLPAKQTKLHAYTVNSFNFAVFLFSFISLISQNMKIKTQRKESLTIKALTEVILKLVNLKSQWSSRNAKTEN